VVVVSVEEMRVKELDRSEAQLDNKRLRKNRLLWRYRVKLRVNYCEILIAYNFIVIRQA